MLNRRTFFSSVVGVLVGVKKAFSLSPAASAGQPTCENEWTCVACGDHWHTSSLCPINRAAMGLPTCLTFPGVSMETAAAWVAIHVEGKCDVATWGGQSMFPVISGVGDNPTGDVVAFVMPKGWDGIHFPEPYSGPVIQRSMLAMGRR